MEEIKKLITDLGRAFEEFKAENDKRIKIIEKQGSAPADIVEKVEKINRDVSEISAMKRQLETIETAVARGQYPGGGSAKDQETINKAKAFTHLMRGDIGAIKD